MSADGFIIIFFNSTQKHKNSIQQYHAFINFQLL